MIRYALVCDKKHEFESWFADSAAYDKQAKRGLVTCPQCGSGKVEKAIMAPQLANTKKRSKATTRRTSSYRRDCREASTRLSARLTRSTTSLSLFVIALLLSILSLSSERASASEQLWNLGRVYLRAQVAAY